MNQPHGKVWFLAGSSGLTGVERTCTIPPNRALFYPLINVSWTDCPGTPDEDLTDAEVRDLLANNAAGDLACQLTSTLDGISISSLQIPIVRTQSPKFTTVLPENNIIAGVVRLLYPRGRPAARSPRAIGSCCRRCPRESTRLHYMVPDVRR